MLGEVFLIIVLIRLTLSLRAVRTDFFGQVMNDILVASNKSDLASIVACPGQKFPYFLNLIRINPLFLQNLVELFLYGFFSTSL